MKTLIKAMPLYLLGAATLFAQNMDMNGKWKMIKSKSSFLDYYAEMTLDITVNKKDAVIITRMGPKRKYEEKLAFTTDGKSNRNKITDGTFSTNIHMGLRLPLDGDKEIRANWEKDGSLKVVQMYDYFASQGKKRGEMIYRYELSPNKDLLTCTLERSTRQKGPETKYVFKRYDADNAYLFAMVDDWDIHSKLPEQACWISLQGVVNQHKPLLYFTFGPQYPFNYTADLANYLETQRNFSFTPLTSLEQGLTAFREHIKGYVVWDKNVRTSLIVAYTLAGLENAIVISEELVPLAKKMGLTEIDDYRGRFIGQSDYEIYTWAKEKYWSRCSREVISWLGGVHGSALMPACADYGMMKKAFFSDLSARPTDAQEYQMTNALFAEMNPLGTVWGWHSYKKDLEEQMTTLLSSYALISDGLNTMPNTSFLIHIPVSPGFKFKNNHNLTPGKKYIPEKKIYLALVQTDGLGIGAWLKPGRGSIPYAWEVTMKFEQLSPVMLEYYYAQALPNDFFIGSLSGSSYMYPKAFPKKWLPKELQRAAEYMKKLDLNVFEIMDYSEGGTETCDNNLPKDLVDEYYRSMPDAIGFINGYRSSNTFTVRDKRPMISYDYYLAAEKSEEEVVADLEELAVINAKLPYFLLVHVRESSDVARVKSICDKLSKNIEVVPLDVFLKMAGEEPTFQEYYYQGK
ncbi:MAG TPA: GxGYxYP family putative glycoside hydrolase [bacterium]|nr:GxGYxYP family putative glycoside hydrolase [bacterium]